MFNLTAIDQSPVQIGSKNKKPAPQLSAELALICENAGYSRYWLAEHHNAPYFSGPSPATLISHIASITKKIRVGSGGVMLSHYSPYMVAEQFRLLATLFPDRIDLGIGRAPGGDGYASAALAYPGHATYGEIYARQAKDLKSFLVGDFEKGHPFENLITSPFPKYNPEFWMLGSSGGSAALAGELGYNLALALFIAPTGQKYDIVENYLHAYEKAGHKEEPKIMIAVGAYCAKTRDEAHFIASSQLYKKTLQQIGAQDDVWQDPVAIQNLKKQFSPREQRFYDLLSNSFVIGSPEECREQLAQIKNYWKTDEIALLTVTHDFESRAKSYQLLGDAIS